MTPRPSHRVTRTVLAAGISAGLAVAAPVLVSIGSTTPAYAASSPGRSGDATATAQWLHGELFAPGNAEGMPVGAMPNFGQADWGLTIDTYWAMEAGGLGQDQLAPTWAAVEANAAEFAGPSHLNEGFVPDWQHAYDGGATAKVLLAAETAGADPTKIRTADGAVYDFRQRTLDLIAKSGTEKGRLTDTPSLGSTTNLFDQSLAVLGLVGGGDLSADDRVTLQSAVDFMRSQQCDAGFFRTAYDDHLSCQAAIPSGAATPENDATAMGVQALMAAKSAGLSVPQSSIDAALDQLTSVQNADGSFGGGVWTPGANTNSTGLAAAALEAGGRTAASQKAGDWVASLEATPANAAGTLLAADFGAVAYSSDDFQAARSAGVEFPDTWTRASAQGIFGLVRVPFIDLVGASSPPTTTPTTPPVTETTSPPPASPTTGVTASATSSAPSSTAPVAPTPPRASSAPVPSSSPTSPISGVRRLAGPAGALAAQDPADGAATSSDVSATEAPTATNPSPTSSAADSPATTADSPTATGLATVASDVVAATPLGDTGSSTIPTYVWAVLGGVLLGGVFLVVNALRGSRS